MQLNHDPAIGVVKGRHGTKNVILGVQLDN